MRGSWGKENILGQHMALSFVSLWSPLLRQKQPEVPGDSPTTPSITIMRDGKSLVLSLWDTTMWHHDLWWETKCSCTCSFTSCSQKSPEKLMAKWFWKWLWRRYYCQDSNSSKEKFFPFFFWRRWRCWAKLSDFQRFKGCPMNTVRVLISLQTSCNRKLPGDIYLLKTWFFLWFFSWEPLK